MAALAPELFAAASAAIGQKTPGGDAALQTVREFQSILYGAHFGATRNTQTYLFMGHDKGNGHMYLQGDKLRIEWPDKTGIFNTANEKLYDMSKADSSIFVKGMNNMMVII